MPAVVVPVGDEDELGAIRRPAGGKIVTRGIRQAQGIVPSAFIR